MKLTNWGRVYYTNLLGIVPLLVLSVAFDETSQLASTVQWSTPTIVWLVVSCALGVAISYFQFLARFHVSTTSFLVLGNICKVLTIVANCLVWNKHTNADGLLSIFISLVASVFYKQAPLRAEAGKMAAGGDATDAAEDTKGKAGGSGQGPRVPGYDKTS